MKLWHEFYPLKSLKSNQKYGVFLKNLKIRVNSRKFESPIQTATYPLFTKGRRERPVFWKGSFGPIPKYCHFVSTTCRLCLQLATCSRLRLPTIDRLRVVRG